MPVKTRMLNPASNARTLATYRRDPAPSRATSEMSQRQRQRESAPASLERVEFERALLLDGSRNPDLLQAVR